MKQIVFHRALKQHCVEEKADCTKCCLRLYCYTPPCERTDSMMEKVISFLEIQHSKKVADDHSDHYTCVHQPQCPRDLSKDVLRVGPSPLQQLKEASAEAFRRLGD